LFVLFSFFFWPLPLWYLQPFRINNESYEQWGWPVMGQWAERVGEICRAAGLRLPRLT
jgi:hypothetical protein